MVKARISSWELYFEKIIYSKDRQYSGKQNRHEVVKSFVEFWLSPEKKLLLMPGRCRIGGFVTEHPFYEENDQIVTSYLVSIEKKRIPKYLLEEVRKADFEEDLFSPTTFFEATTETGHKYCFFGYERNAFMSLMLYDMYEFGHLKDRDNYYLMKELYNTQFL